ncbi:uncharacterized protein LOC115621902 [Scaptodrosophila lebanonensis]|uniref:RING-type E3 ubiquitin transferase n=1 Tax=Drosophila lebanonensis TaxID=7225 RepID=A0A6J2T9G9_DROLE|nr:uncharacterized protein LOC115621902 [Scaptodrosophila lebanonensis]
MNMPDETLATRSSSDSCDSCIEESVPKPANASQISSYFMCLVCMRTARNPRVSFCGHHFCGKCIQHWLRMQGDDCKCPYCMSQIGENTLIMVRHNRLMLTAPYSSARSLAQTRKLIFNTSEYNKEMLVLPEAGMFITGYVEYPPELMPRIRPLPQELLRQVSRRPVRRWFLEPQINQRVFTLVILVFMFAMSLSMGVRE